MRTPPLPHPRNRPRVCYITSTSDTNTLPFWPMWDRKKRKNKKKTHILSSCGFTPVSPIVVLHSREAITADVFFTEETEKVRREALSTFGFWLLMQLQARLWLPHSNAKGGFWKEEAGFFFAIAGNSFFFSNITTEVRCKCAGSAN